MNTFQKYLYVFSFMIILRFYCFQLHVFPALSLKIPNIKRDPACLTALINVNSLTHQQVFLLHKTQQRTKSCEKMFSLSLPPKDIFILSKLQWTPTGFCECFYVFICWLGFSKTVFLVSALLWFYLWVNSFKVPLQLTIIYIKSVHSVLLIIIISFLGKKKKKNLCCYRI